MQSTKQKIYRKRTQNVFWPTTENLFRRDGVFSNFLNLELLYMVSLTEMHSKQPFERNAVFGVKKMVESVTFFERCHASNLICAPCYKKRALCVIHLLSLCAWNKTETSGKTKPVWFLTYKWKCIHEKLVRQRRWNFFDFSYCGKTLHGCFYWNAFAWTQNF